MYLLKQLAYHMLGPKWKYYRKIKKGNEGLQLLKEKSLMEQMKATQAALRFTSKSAKKNYRNVFQACIKDIRLYTDIPKEELPQLPEAEGGGDPPSLTSRHDEIIISWTPIKFFLPAKQIREKGAATQRHTEGLIAKLFFKVVAFYADSENWDFDKLSFYLLKLNKHSTYQEVSSVLETLKTDLTMFTEAFEPFKFGKASLSKDSSQEDDTFDDAMAVESFDSQVRTLYWYGFIYWATELFLFRYFLTLITSTDCIQAIRYLANIFETAIEKVIENRIMFIGSFEIDRSKKEYRDAYEKYTIERINDPNTTRIKTQKGIFETYLYNFKMLENSTINFELQNLPGKNSEWGKFIKYHILNVERPVVERKEGEFPDFRRDTDFTISLEAREYALMQIMAMMVKCIRFKRQARHKILERFKKRVVADKELAEKRIEELKKQGEKKLQSMERKVSKLKRLKQTEAVGVFEKDIQQFKVNLNNRCKGIQQGALKELHAQKQRLQVLFKAISKENSINAGETANIVLRQIEEIDEEGQFVEVFIKYVTNDIQDKCNKELEPFYENIFNIIKPSIQEKILIIQSIKKSDFGASLNLSLTDEEEEEFETMIRSMKENIDQISPDILKSKLVFLSLVFPLEHVFRFSIDNRSLKALMRLKVMMPKGGKPTNIPAEAVKNVLVLNMMMNPVPLNNLIIDGKENEKDPQKIINNSLLNKLVSEIT